MDSPAPTWTQKTSQETRSHLLMPTLAVSKPIPNSGVIVVLKSSLDNC